MTADSTDRDALVEEIAAKVHEAWMETKREQGVESRPSEWGEEQMVAYADLSERAKDLDRGTVRAVLDAQAALGVRVAPDADADELRRAWRSGLREGRATGPARDEGLRQRIEAVVRSSWYEVAVGRVVLESDLRAALAASPAPGGDEVAAVVDFVCIECQGTGIESGYDDAPPCTFCLGSGYTLAAPGGDTAPRSISAVHGDHKAGTQPGTCDACFGWCQGVADSAAYEQTSGLDTAPREDDQIVHIEAMRYGYWEGWTAAKEGRQYRPPTDAARPVPPGPAATRDGEEGT